MSEKLLYAANMLVSKCWRSQVSPEKIKEIVVVKWDEIGDMATAVHVFQLLKDYAPAARLTLLCKPFVGSLIQADPHVDMVVFGTNELPKKADVWIELRGTWHTWWISLWRTKKCDWIGVGFGFYNGAVSLMSESPILELWSLWLAMYHG